jgi:hypothetical protein
MGLALSGDAGLFPEWFTGNIVSTGVTLTPGSITLLEKAFSPRVIL